MINLALNKILFIVWMVFCCNHIWAQSTNNVPEIVITAIEQKYPAAEVKKWNLTNNKFTAKANDHGLRYFAAFDEKGNWLNTTTKVGWPWKLPPAVKAAFNKSKYKNWNMYTLKIIENPSGEFYQILVDGRNHSVDIFHQDLATEHRTVVIKSNGEMYSF